MPRKFRLAILIAVIPAFLFFWAASSEAQGQHPGGPGGGHPGGPGGGHPGGPGGGHPGGPGGGHPGGPGGGHFYGSVYIGGYWGWGYPYPYYSPFWGYYPWYPYPFNGYAYGYPYYGSPYYGYPYGYYEDPRAALRLQVTPRQTEVYVDGYSAGVVDQYDGMFQRLHLPPGNHEIVLYLDGYKSVRQTLYLAPGSDQRIVYAMVPLAAGEAQEPRPAPTAPPQQYIEPQGQPGAPPPQYTPPQGQAPQGAPPGRMPGGQPPPPIAAVEASGFGTLAIRVQPGGAEVFIDGERWQGPETADRLVVQVSEGTHRVEVRKDGYVTYTSQVQVRYGETTALNVSLPPR